MATHAGHLNSTGGATSSECHERDWFIDGGTCRCRKAALTSEMLAGEWGGRARGWGGAVGGDQLRVKKKIMIKCQNSGKVWDMLAKLLSFNREASEVLLMC